MASAVLAASIEYRYPSGRTGLRPLDLEIRAGEIVVVLGPNGSGKSTLLKLFASDVRPRGGKLTIVGAVVGAPLRRHRRYIGYTPDIPVHLPWLTGRENARLFLELKRVWTAPTRARATELFRSFGLEEVADVPVSEYSFGMERKLLLLEALAPSHPLLLLDEPTVGLDPDGAAALREAVRERAREGAAVVIATNDTREIPRWADRVIFLHRGMLVEDASLPELLARLDGKTRIEVSFAEPLTGPIGEFGLERTALEEMAEEALPQGVLSLTWTVEGAYLESSSGTSPLPEILRLLIDRGVTVRSVRVREPDLGDLFRQVTGVAISDEGSEP